MYYNLVDYCDKIATVICLSYFLMILIADQRCYFKSIKISTTFVSLKNIGVSTLGSVNPNLSTEPKYLYRNLFILNWRFI